MADEPEIDESESDEDSPHAAAKFDWSLAEGLEVTAPPRKSKSLKDRIREALESSHE